MTALTNLPDPPGIRELRRMIDQAGAQLTIARPSAWHWRVTGGVHDVNWYPESRSRMMYVNGATAGRTATARDVFETALGQAPGSVSEAPGKRRDTTGIKRQLYKRDPHCHWCGRRVWQGVPCDPMIRASLDHKIPVSKGGSSRRDNCVLSCVQCNRDRGNSLAPPPSRS